MLMDMDKIYIFIMTDDENIGLNLIAKLLKVRVALAAGLQEAKVTPS